MSTTTIESIENFATGVVASRIPEDKLPDSAYARAYNTAFSPSVGGGVTLRPRPGLRKFALLSTSSATTVRSMSNFTSWDDGVRDDRQVGLDSDGRLWDLNDASPVQITIPIAAGEFVDNGGGEALLDGDTWVWQEANNALYGVSGAGGNDAVKIFKRPGVSTLYAGPIGLAMPGAPTEGTVTAGLMTGDYNFLVTWYDSVTDTESSPGAVLALTLASNQVVINKPTGVPSTATHWRLYIEKPTTQTQYWRNAAMQIAIGTSNFTCNFDDDALTLQVIPAPLGFTKDPLPANAIALAWHLSRLFATDGINLYYSNPGHPEEWDIRNPGGRRELVNPQDGQRITALVQINELTLANFKERGIYLLEGDDPSNWAVTLFSKSFGAYSRHVVSGDNFLAFWGERGPTIWTGSASTEPYLIANEVLGRYEAMGVFSFNQDFTNYPIAYDPNGHRFLFSATLTGAAARWTCLPWNTLQRGWESSGWDLPAVASLATMHARSGDRRVFIGAAAASDPVVWELAHELTTEATTLDTAEDLIYTVVSSRVTEKDFTFTSAVTVPVNTIGYNSVAMIDPLTLRVWRQRLNGNLAVAGTTVTGTVVAWDRDGTAPPAGCTIVFNTPVFEWDSRRVAKKFIKKRFHRAWLELETNGDTPVAFGFYQDDQLTPTRAWAYTHRKTTTDEFGSDLPPTIAGSVVNFKGRIAGSGWAWWQRVIGWYPQSRWALSRVAAEWEPRSYAR